MRRKFRLVAALRLLFAFVLLGIGSVAFGQGSTFTYQGRLTDGGTPANSPPGPPYQMQFTLFPSAVGGDPIAPPIQIDSVEVANGVFTVQLDFGGAAAFDGHRRWLQIAVKGPTDHSFSLLTPRQPLTSTPYALRTSVANSADTLSSACTLCVTDAHIQAVDGSKVTGTVPNASTALNVTGVVQIAHGGTGSPTKNFVDLSSDQDIGGSKVFTGNSVTVLGDMNASNFNGDGTGLFKVPGTLKWQTVSGQSQQALPNNGYITSNDGPATITLPTSPNIGDVIRVSASGAGGWKIVGDAGQLVVTENINLNFSGWTPHESIRSWISVASSAEGTNLVAAVSGGQIFTSNDSGDSWMPHESNRPWQAVASSADGTKLVAIASDPVNGGGRIYTSTDSGAVWTPRENTRFWHSVASSADGTRLVAVDGGFNLGGQIYTSTDSGVSWTPRESNRLWWAVASSADGTKLVAVVNSGQIYTSINSGAVWTPHENNRFWRSVASSADGTKLAAVFLNGQILTSIDSGISWTAHEANRNWVSIASSADGTRLVAAVQNSRIYTSTDSGATWKAQENDHSWSSVASSADGTKLIAVDLAGQIYTSQHPLGRANTMVGGQFSSIELLYLGGGLFLPISHEGTIVGFN